MGIDPFGNGRPAAIRNAGNRTAWKAHDILAHHVQVAGQNFAYRIFFIGDKRRRSG